MTDANSPTPSACAGSACAPGPRPVAGAVSEHLLSASVRAQRSAGDAGATLLAVRGQRSGGRRGPDLTDDTGAQAAEYAMLSGVGVAIAAAVIAVLRRGDLVQNLISALIDVLIAFVTSWFGG